MSAPSQSNAADQHLDENHIMAERRAKLAELRQAGIAFPNDFLRENLAQKVHDGYGAKTAEELEKKGADPETLLALRVKISKSTKMKLNVEGR